ncbi:MAG: hypothetical protein K8F92_02905 [Hyphomicrobium sp.]|uniref:hypothetical protein n=1 Tax=Hyphomicrobium sp. TaxID=82 RepID=UPI00132BAF0D|nr:hypothetical protein [Hyphomicrobium sp.]KAB2942606.1 MAG: hypothetical protein F9K20_06390 [Hyphomicrobium sp.]MBZ0208590.1 hypothetical protein [Hyphomicrobium sp.]
MLKAQQFIGQALFYALVACTIGYLSSRPFYAGFPQDAAQIKLSFSHGAAHREACRKLSYQEIIKLKGSERRPSTCARQRMSVRAQLLLDGRTIYDAVLQPTGLWGDGPARTYQKFVVPAGRHTVEARMRDSGREQGFDYENRTMPDLRPGQSLAIDFRADSGGFTFR